jgi:hypothetical protein
MNRKHWKETRDISIDEKDPLDLREDEFACFCDGGLFRPKKIDMKICSWCGRKTCPRCRLKHSEENYRSYVGRGGLCYRDDDIVTVHNMYGSYLIHGPSGEKLYSTKV